METKRNPMLLLAGVSISGVFLGAFAFVVATYFSLPASDGAYRIGLSAVLRDPFVLAVTVPASFVVGILALPLVCWCLRYKKMAVTAPLTIFAPVLSIALCAPFLGPISVIVGIIVLVAVLLYARQNVLWNLERNERRA
jgi:hypothetical protein